MCPEIGLKNDSTKTSIIKKRSKVMDYGKMMNIDVTVHKVYYKMNKFCRQ